MKSSRCRNDELRQPATLRNRASAGGVSGLQHLLKDLAFALDQRVQLLLLLGHGVPQRFRVGLPGLDFLGGQDRDLRGVFHFLPFEVADQYLCIGAPDFEVGVFALGERRQVLVLLRGLRERADFSIEFALPARFASSSSVSGPA